MPERREQGELQLSHTACRPTLPPSEVAKSWMALAERISLALTFPRVVSIEEQFSRSRHAIHRDEPKRNCQMRSSLNRPFDQGRPLLSDRFILGVRLLAAVTLFLG